MNLVVVRIFPHNNNRFPVCLVFHVVTQHRSSISLHLFQYSHPDIPMTFNWRRPFTRRQSDGLTNSESHYRPNGPFDGDGGTVSDGSLQYTVEKGGNDSPPAYQEATGAPVEVNSPLGYSVGPLSIIMLNIGKMIGTGVYSTREQPLHLFSHPSSSAFSVRTIMGWC